LDDECWHDAARSGRHVQEGGRRDARHEAAGPTIEKVRIEVDGEVDVLQAVEEDGKGNPGDLDRLLDDVALSGRDRDRRLPVTLLNRPSEDDAFPAVLVIRLQDQVL